MIKKLTFLGGIGVGVLAASKSSREKVLRQVRTVWRDPRTQQRADQAQVLAKEQFGQAASVAAEKAGKAKEAAAVKMNEARDKKKSDDSTESGSSGGQSSGTPSTAPGTSSADTGRPGDSTPMGTSEDDKGPTRP